MTETTKTPLGTLLVYVALPMNGVQGITVRNNFDRMTKFIRHRHTAHDIEFINQNEVLQAAEESDSEPVRYKESQEFATIGGCLQTMQAADIVYFHPDWINSHGCRIEMEACEFFGKPHSVIPKYWMEPRAFRFTV